ncbi:kinase-like domain-containing protein [Scenedesmus sp. NREL 46B-D3]|nr:kinase-like domain-containing protein [Scenedesmus sp. NREL 46B-D3]
MHHLHSEGVLHGDLKADNALAPSGSSAAGNGAGHSACDQVVAKVADLGLACVLEEQDTHISGVHRGTLSHMSPELLLHGRASRASDVYAMGCLLYHVATGRRVFANIPKALLGAAVVRDGLLLLAAGTSSLSAAQQQPGEAPAELHPPLDYRRLAEACWQHEPQDRPTFAEVTAMLEQLLEQEQHRQAMLAAQARQQQAASVAGRTAAARRSSPPAPPSTPWTRSQRRRCFSPACGRRHRRCSTQGAWGEGRCLRADTVAAVAAVLGTRPTHAAALPLAGPLKPAAGDDDAGLKVQATAYVDPHGTTPAPLPPAGPAPHAHTALRQPISPFHNTRGVPWT